MNKLSNFLKSKRNEKNMSLREFSEYLGISHAYLNKLEKGIDEKTGKEISPTIDTLLKVAASLDINTVSFFDICGYFDNNKYSNETYCIDISKYVENIISKMINADNITINNKPINKSDTDTISIALEVALQIVLRNHHEQNN